MKPFEMFSVARTNVPIKDIFGTIFDAIKCVKTILSSYTNYEQLHRCCHILTAIAHLQTALLKSSWTEVYEQEYSIKKLLENAFFDLYVFEKVIII